ncbi:MAG: hypothetical protein K2M17_05420 [Bacilli bacterium]|nr:hypothetical protein [Bacilli bacterium]
MKKINKFLAFGLVAGVLVLPLPTKAIEKTENIYTHVNYEGEVKKSLVNNHLYMDQTGNIEDMSLLDSIVNLNGDETFTTDGNKVTWKGLGKDIFYQGVTTSELPMSIRITYSLDDKVLNAKDMVGKKGKVKIEYKFFNNSFLKSKNMYMPFTVMVATTMNNKENRGIKVVNGKVIDTGNKSYLVGLSSPGLYESMNLKEFKDFDKVIIEYETTSFSLNETYVVATPKLLDEMDFSVFDKMNDLYNSIHLMGNSMDKIESGAIALENGAEALVAGSKEIVDSLKTVKDAIGQLENGAGQLDAGILQVIAALDGASSMLDDPKINGSVANIQYLIGQNEQMISYLRQAGEIQNEQMIQLLEGNVTALTSVLETLNDMKTKITGMLSELHTALNTIEAGTRDLGANLTKVKTGVSKLHSGSLELNAGIVTLQTGVKTLSSGITELNQKGINVLENQVTHFNDYSKKARELAKLAEGYNGFASDNAEKSTFIYKIDGLG